MPLLTNNWTANIYLRPIISGFDNIKDIYTLK
jgi:hypothetical protein